MYLPVLVNVFLIIVALALVAWAWGRIRNRPRHPADPLALHRTLAQRLPDVIPAGHVCLVFLDTDPGVMMSSDHRDAAPELVPDAAAGIAEAIRRGKEDEEDLIISVFDDQRRLLGGVRAGRWHGV